MKAVGNTLFPPSPSRKIKFPRNSLALNNRPTYLNVTYFTIIFKQFLQIDIQCYKGLRLELELILNVNGNAKETKNLMNR